MFTARTWARRPFILTPWQKQLIIDLFETEQVPVTDSYGEPVLGDDGAQVTETRRRYRWALIGMPRKNGKTELMAALALWFLLGEITEDTPVIVVAATSDRQANLIFSAAARMAVYSPTLSSRVDVFGGEIQARARPEAKIVRVSSKARTAHGLNISHLICDELHEWPAGAGDELWDVLTTGMSAGVDPLVLQITTAGHDLDNTKCGEQYRHGRAVESGTDPDHAYFFRWWQAPDNCRIDDVAAHKIANPAYGIIKGPAWFDDMVRRLRPALFRRLELNQWTALANAWLPEGAWFLTTLAPGPENAAAQVLRLALDVHVQAAPATARARFPIPDDADPALVEWREQQVADAVAAAEFERDVVRFALASGLRPDLPVFIGWDGSAKLDSTAVVAAQEQPQAAGDSRIRFVPWIWDRPWSADRHRYDDEWLAPMEEIGDTLQAIAKWFPVETVAFDANLVRWEALKLYAAGLPLLEIKQAGAIMEQASQALYEAVMRKVAAHDGNVKLAQHIGNAAARQSKHGSGAWRLAKAEAPRKMDGAVAAAMALWALQHPPEKPEPPAPVIVRTYYDRDADDEWADEVERI